MAEMLPSGPTAHVDTFCRDSLPPPEHMPHMDYGVLPELAAYPSRVNAATELLDKRVAAGDGGRPVFHVHGGHWTYRQLLETANRIAHVLVEDLGVVPGNRVLLRGPNNPMLAACWLAVLKAGGVVVCTMPLLRVRELTYIADKAKIRLALTDARVAAECESAMVPSGGRVIHFHSPEDEGSLESLMRGKPATFENCATAADDPALIAFTSGTTGQGKGTIHFHRDLLAVCDTFAAHVLKADRDDVFCGSPPLAFTYGLGGLLLFPLHIGASTLLLEQAAPQQLLQGIQEHRATVVFTAPTAYRAMFDLVKGSDISSLRKCVSAGETLPKATFEKWKELTGLEIIDGIGSTEMLHMFISSSGDEIRPGATGRVVPGYEARVMDDEGQEVPPGTLGHLAVRGPTGCRYIDNLERQATYVRDGWNYPGDSYIMDAEGYFWYQARTDDMIISAGNNISGPEVEAVLLEHPSVAECGVVAAPDEMRGNIVKAYVVLRSGFAPGPDLIKELQEFVKAEIAPYKYPRAIEFVASLPRTNTGKLQRFRLREMNK
jgi:2-aminobenzoate-CoA ligase